MSYKMKEPSPMLMGGLFTGVLSMQISPFLAIVLGGLISSFVTFLLKACEPIVREWGEAKAEEMRRKRAELSDRKRCNYCGITGCSNCNTKNDMGGN